MRKKFFAGIIALTCCICGVTDMTAQSTRPERKLIDEGNKLYVGRKFSEAATRYQQALSENGNSAVARYNLGLAQIKQVTNPNDTTPKNRQLLDQARQNLMAVAAMAKDKPGLAAKANYNLGNLEFNTNQFKEAIEFYKQALRIDPNDNAARKNLRISHLKQQNQNQDKNQNKDKNQDKNKDQNKDQNKAQNKNQDQNQDKNKQDKQQPKEKDISQQAAGQILQAIDNKENQTRARVNQARKGDKSAGAAGRHKRW